MMTFYLGREYDEYDKMFDVISLYCAEQGIAGSKAATFRWMVRMFHGAIDKLNGSESVKKEVNAIFDELDKEEVED